MPATANSTGREGDRGCLPGPCAAQVLGGAVKDSASGARENAAEGVHEKTKSALSREALDRIAPLYKIEATIRGRTPDQRLAVRAEHTEPLLAELRDWMQTTLGRISGRSDLAKALRYSEPLRRPDPDPGGRPCVHRQLGGGARHPTDRLGPRNWTVAG